MNFEVEENDDADDIETGEGGAGTEWDDRKGLEPERGPEGGLRDGGELLHAPNPSVPNLEVEG